MSGWGKEIIRKGKLVGNYRGAIKHFDNGQMMNDCMMIRASEARKVNKRGTTFGGLIHIGWALRKQDYASDTTPVPHAVIGFSTDIHHCIMNEEQFNNYINVLRTTRERMRKARSKIP